MLLFISPVGSLVFTYWYYCFSLYSFFQNLDDWQTRTVGMHSGIVTGVRPSVQWNSHSFFSFRNYETRLLASLFYFIYSISYPGWAFPSLRDRSANPLSPHPLPPPLFLPVIFRAQKSFALKSKELCLLWILSSEVWKNEKGLVKTKQNWTAISVSRKPRVLDYTIVFEWMLCYSSGCETGRSARNVVFFSPRSVCRASQRPWMSDPCCIMPKVKDVLKA